MASKKAAIIGGDLRQEYMAEILKEKGMQVTVYGPGGKYETGSMDEAIRNAEVIIAPIPLTKDGIRINAPSPRDDLTLEQLVNSLHSGQVLCAGCITEELFKKCSEKKVKTVDFMKNEQITIFNSIATAEGAICEAILQYPSNVHNSKCMILGFGRCAKTLADKLKGLSVKVSICARSDRARAEAEAYGYSAYSFYDLKSEIHRYHLIFNTVPAMVLGEEELVNVQKDTVIIDIASSPGGVDFEAAKRLGKNAGLCLGLPGRYSPRSSAEELVKWIVQIDDRYGGLT